MLLLSGFTAGARSAEVTATVDRSEISIEETLNLKIRYQGKSQSNLPDLGDLEKNFDILSQSRSNQFRSFNGQVEAWVEWSIVIAPKRKGTLMIPSFNIDGDYTTAIEINVGDAKPVNLADGQAKDIFLETEIDQNNVYVQQQVLLKVRLNTSLPVASVNRSNLELPQAKVEEVSEQNYNRTINGRDYAVYELVFAIYPQESGELQIPVMTWEANIGSRSTSLFDLYSRQNTLRRLRTSEKTITVQPKPADYPGDQWLPAKNLVISESWSDGFPEFVQGEPITRNITVTADGLTASQLPNLNVQYPDGFNKYPESPKIDEQKSAQGIVTNALQTQALLVTKPGTYTLPEVSLSWWNTQKNKAEVVTLPPRNITVKASPNAAPPPPIVNVEPSQPSDEAITNVAVTPAASVNWLILLLSNLITALAVGALTWQYVRRRLPNKMPPAAVVSTGAKSYKQLLKQLKQVCGDKNPSATRETLKQLSRQLFPYGAGNLHALQIAAEDERFKNAVSNLDRSLFDTRAQVDIDYSAIVAGVESLLENQQRAQTNKLEPLNPALST